MGEFLQVSFHELPLASSEAPKVDGRRLRGERTRLAIIAAYLELLRRNPQMPTGAQLADQAGCSVRSIFERFSDLNALRLAVADYAIAQGQAELAVLISFESWDQMRHCHGLSMEAAQDVWRSAIDRMLPSAVD